MASWDLLPHNCIRPLPPPHTHPLYAETLSLLVCQSRLISGHRRKLWVGVVGSGFLFPQGSWKAPISTFFPLWNSRESTSYVFATFSDITTGRGDRWCEVLACPGNACYIGQPLKIGIATFGDNHYTQPPTNLSNLKHPFCTHCQHVATANANLQELLLLV